MYILSNGWKCYKSGTTKYLPELVCKYSMFSEFEQYWKLWKLTAIGTVRILKLLHAHIANSYKNS